MKDFLKSFKKDIECKLKNENEKTSVDMDKVFILKGELKAINKIMNHLN